MTDGGTSYQKSIQDEIKKVIESFECQPILFIGSGLSLRYFGAPTWRLLLEMVFDRLPKEYGIFEYYQQKFNDDPILIGTKLSEIVFEWAWKEGKNQFPSELFGHGIKKDAFLKYMVCDIIRKITINPDKVKKELKAEVKALALIKPHAVITTNYDLFLENVFDGYVTITGQTIIRYNTNSFGEIFHIHGDVSDPQTIVLTQVDYDEWTEKKKYISAKLLTYFAEHPVFIIGYGVGDPNIKTILKDIGELVADESGLIENVYHVIWHPVGDIKTTPSESVFAIDGKEYRTRAIHATSFEWLFEAMQGQSPLASVNLKLIRALAARTMRLVRHDIPSGNVAVNYDVLERIASDSTHLPNILGITAINNPNQSHPLTITQVAEMLGLKNWNAVDKLIKKIEAEKGVNIRESDNRYHCRIKTGKSQSSNARKWSHESVDLFGKVLRSEPYEVHCP